MASLDELSAYPTALNLRRDAVLQMQRTLGNAHVQRLLADRRRSPFGAGPVQHAAVLEGRVAPAVPKAVPIEAMAVPHEAKPGPELLQRWEEKEHKLIGDEATGGTPYPWKQSGKSTAKYQFELTHGDLVLLSGDHFDPRDTIIDPTTKKKVPNPDSLFRIASRVSTNPGKDLGTQDEIVFVLRDNVPSDPRFKKGGIWEWAADKDKAFSEEVKKSAGDRFLRLAATNREHFVSPTGKPAGKQAVLGESAGGSYRALHEDAIERAFAAGQNNAGINGAMVREAAAQHFLTDAFSAGHVRTPISAIRDYWQAKYPHFWGNMKKKIAMDVARYANAHETSSSTVAGTVLMIYDQIYGAIEEKAGSMPAISFGDVVGRVVHDLDNIEGVNVINDVGKQWKALGDNKLKADKTTKDEAVLAVQLGNQDIRNAYKLGQANPGRVAAGWIQQEVKKQAGNPATPGNNYAPEQLIPRVDPSKEKSTQNWKAGSYIKLWSMPVRSDKPGVTFGKAIQDSLAPGGAFGTKLDAFKDQFPKEQSGIHPQIAYEKGFLNPLRDKSKTLQKLGEIISYDPSRGQTHENIDDAALEYLSSMTDEELQGLTVEQRAAHIGAMVKGTFSETSEEEERRVVMLFATASPSERPRIYELVEGHKWEGDWKHGVFDSDDEIWNALSRSRLKELRKIINGGKGPKDGTGWTERNLLGQSMDQRVKLVKALIGGVKVPDWMGERVILVFKYAPAKDRPKIYEGVEGRKWTGDFISGYTTADDDIYNALTPGQLTRLKQLINQGR